MTSNATDDFWYDLITFNITLAACHVLMWWHAKQYGFIRFCFKYHHHFTYFLASSHLHFISSQVPPFIPSEFHSRRSLSLSLPHSSLNYANSRLGLFYTCLFLLKTWSFYNYCQKADLFHFVYEFTGFKIYNCKNLTKLCLWPFMLQGGRI